jgi:hypothetical protein
MSLAADLPLVAARGRAPRTVQITPMAGLFGVVVVTNLLSVPMARLLGAEDFKNMEFGVSEENVTYAYYWTLYGLAALVVLYFVLGIHRLVSEYQRLPLVAYSPDGYRRFWTISFAAGAFAAALMFVQAGLRIPALEGFGTDYFSYGKIRMYFGERINGTLFNVALFWFATSNVTVAWLHGLSKGHRIASVALFLFVASFSLARSPLGCAVLMAFGYRLMWQRIAWWPLVQGVVLMSVGFVAVHYLAGDPSGYGGMGEYLWVRLFYGQWGALPYYFSIFENNHVSWTAMVGPLMQNTSIADFQSPSRIVMEFMCPDGVYDGRAGVASGFFIGEAYAVAGIPGVIVSPLVVMLQVLVIAVCFRRLPKTTLNMLLYSWFLYKVFLGVTGGFSQFFASFLQLMLLVLVYWVMVSGLLTRLGSTVKQARLLVPRK